MASIGDVLNHKHGKPPERRKWIGSHPTCDICGVDCDGKEFVDGKTQLGPWGLMCRSCHRQHGVGLGFGRGQLYDKDRYLIEGGR